MFPPDPDSEYKGRKSENNAVSNKRINILFTHRQREKSATFVCADGASFQCFPVAVKREVKLAIHALYAKKNI